MWIIIFKNEFDQYDVVKNHLNKIKMFSSEDEAYNYVKDILVDVSMFNVIKIYI